MKFKWRNAVIFLLIISVAVFLRFYQLDKVPPGLIIDEASEGYNAFSLLNTGKDRYGESFPILFRSFGSYQAPLYTYLATIPIYFLGNSILSIHLVSAVSGILLVIITFIILSSFFKQNIILAAIGALLLAISPWSVFFSRFATEASLGVTLFVLSFLIFYLSTKRLWLFPIAAVVLGLSTHAYYSERLISVLFLAGFILLFKKILFTKKKMLVLGLVIFAVTQIPHLIIFNSGAFTRRITQVDYFNEQFFQNNSGGFRNMFLGKPIFIVREFASQYMTYFSPKNLFLDPDPQDFRSMPNLSVFYSWMFVPFLFGLRSIMLGRSIPSMKMLILLFFVAPIPAGLTRDPFSTIRILVFLWTITVIIALGADKMLSLFKTYKFRILTLIVFIIFSSVQLYLAYFVLLKYERSENYNYSYIQLLKITEQMRDKKFVIDSTRQLSTGIQFAYFKKYDPLTLQAVLAGQLKGQYYSNFEYDEPYMLDNIEVRPIFWKTDTNKEQILVGDLLAISDNQIKEHNLRFLFDVKDMAGNVVLKAYSTDPKANCEKFKLREGRYPEICRQYFQDE